MSKVELYPETLAAFDGNEQRATVFLDRYARKGADGLPIERTPKEMWQRVANAIASHPAQADRFYRLLDGFKFVPGGRILAGAGIDAKVTYYNCYVIPVETRARRTERHQPVIPSDHGCDSREAIFDTIGLMVDIMSRGGGVGINWSVLRPKGAYLKSVNGTTSGPVSWMDVASRAVGVVEQGGSRRGAAMFMLDDWHPDVEDFIDAKRNFSLITNANVSVAVSEEFMEAVRNDADWSLRFPDTDDPLYNSDWDGDLRRWEAHGGRVKVYRTVRARDLWRHLADAAWASGEPGVVFLGRYNERSTGQGVERIISVNPCGEQGLGPYSVCNLGALNLMAFVGKKKYVGLGTFDSFDFVALGDAAADAVTFLDRVIDTNYYFLPENEKVQKELRRIGIGVMGLADVLVTLGVRYGSPEAVDFTERVFRQIKTAAVSRSAFLAMEHGPAPAWRKKMLSRPYLSGLGDTPVYGLVARNGLRNIFLLTQAPTGTTSILAGVNSGIEPFFGLGYWRTDRTGRHWVTPKSLENIGGPDYPDYVVTAEQVTVEEHIAMQAAAQRYIDSSVSKTINAPNSQTVDEVEKAYTLAYESGLKGIAYFRDGCGRDQVLSHETKKEEPAKMAAPVEAPKPQRSRPATLTGSTVRRTTASGTAYVTVNTDAYGAPYELFVNVGKAGSDVMSLGEAIGRLVSLALRAGIHPTTIATQLRGVGGDSKLFPSIPHVISEALHSSATDVPSDEEEYSYDDGEEEYPDDDEEPQEPEAVEPAERCPQCGDGTVRMEGCRICRNCGWSAC